ncbi:MAG: undecaprenyl-diphosphate phosphatase [Clostridia bacterium]|nr:undecaprenyl-diphosphate phosphatase [Clostridia bacterium]
MDTFFEILKSIFQGIVQGVTEWLPISSTGHMLLLNELLPMNVSKDFFDVFKVVIQLGSILAVLVLYFSKLNPFSAKKTDTEKRGTWSLWGKVLVASIPAAVVGLLIDDWVDGVLSTPLVIAIALIVYGVLFIVMESLHRTPSIDSFDKLSWRTALGIGVFQMLALIPGTSRSGSTILGATCLGATRPVAAEFSFFMAIPVMFGASGLKLVKAAMDGSLFAFTSVEWLLLLIGFVVAFLVSVLVIRLFMNYIRRHDFKGFGVYRIVLGIVVLVLMLLGVFSGTPV